MKRKCLIFIIGIVGIFSCSNNQTQKGAKDEFHESKSAQIIWIEVADSLSNFEALLLTEHLFYLRHMSVDYDNYGKDFWESVDTIKNDSWIYKRLRKGGCYNSTDASKIRLCIEQQEHTINKIIDKVVEFSGNGSGYFATIKYVYDELGNLIEYKHFNKIFYLKYDSENELTEVLKTKISHGISKKTGLLNLNNNLHVFYFS